MLRTILLSLTVLGSQLLFAQQAETTQPRTKIIVPRTGVSSDPALMANAIHDSYYQPDGMSGINCDVSVDWPGFFSAMKLNPPADRLKAIQGLKIRSEAVRDNAANLTFDWTGGTVNGKEQLEEGLKQMIGGFYQMYWSMVAAAPIRKPAEITKIELLPDGGAKVYSSSQNANVVLTVDKENTPTHYTFEIAALKGVMDLSYVPAPKPVPGDLRRISNMDVSEQIGTSNINIKLGLDYQAVDGFYVPGHVSYDVGGAYSLSMEFSGCSVSKAAIADKAN